MRGQLDIYRASCAEHGHAPDIVWVGTPDDVAERVAGIIDVCEGLTEVAITANPGGFAHWQAIKTQEIFADAVAPRFRSAAEGAAAELGTHA